jgi:hypothetical protein
MRKSRIYMDQTPFWVPKGITPNDLPEARGVHCVHVCVGDPHNTTSIQLRVWCEKTNVWMIPPDTTSHVAYASDDFDYWLFIPGVSAACQTIVV